MNKIIAKRGRAKGCITLLATFAESIDESTNLATLEFRLRKLNEAWHDFVALQNELLEFIDEPGYTDREPEFAEYEAKYFEAHAIISNAIRRLEGGPKGEDSVDNQSAKSSQASPMPTKAVHLPEITVPIFSGDYKDWPAFRDMFTGTIDANISLTCTQKLHYLKSFLRGDAANLIKHISCSEQNYVEAWDRLESRFDQKNLIIQSFIHAFLSLPSCTTSNIHMLRKITDGADEAVRGLNALESISRDPWLIHLLIQKLDHETKQAWAEEVGSRDDCTIDEFLKFLQTRCSCLESCISFSRSNPPRNKGSSAIRTHLVESSHGCPKCKGDHTLSHCSEFKSLNVNSRREFVKSNSLCFNCLRQGHASNKCRSTFRCRQCNSRHHTLVHPIQFTAQGVQNSNTSAASSADLSNPLQGLNQPFVSNQALQSDRRHVTILPTALARIQDKQGIYHLFRILLDSGSQVSFITEEVAQCLGLPRKRSRVPIIGIGSTSAGVTNGVVTLKIYSRFNSEFVEINCFVLPKISSCLPSVVLTQLPTNSLPVDLADPNFYLPGPIDILLGADKLFNIITGAAKENTRAGMTTIPTIFGWVMAGRTLQFPQTASELKSYCTRLDHNLEFDLERFWRLEEVSSEPPLSLEEQLAEEHFTKTHFRRPDGKFEVSLPFKPSIQLDFGDSFGTSLIRFHALERRLNVNPSLRAQYSSFINEYLKLGHMEEIAADEPFQQAEQPFYYLPHHAVFKGDSTTTKIRVVFDASAKSKNSVSLNETLLVGPTIQRDIFAICLRSRRHSFLIKGDIEKMYRQIWVSPNHTDFQRILWRENPDDKLKHYRLLTVTYGTSSAPFLAVRVLKQLASESVNTYPHASATILNDFYVDDVITGADTIDDVIALRVELIDLLKTAGFNLRKWTTNCWPLLASLPEEQRELSPVDFEESKSVKMLGLQWCPLRDCFSYNVKLSSADVCTKRRILSDASRIFDPLGFLSPVVIAIKIMFQELWRKHLKWDDKVPETISHRWNTIRNELPLIESLSIPRIMIVNKQNWELHGFCDASLDAYSAVVYCRSISKNNSITVTLVAAKTRVAPLKVLSLPRLELCGALLLTRLINKIKISLQEPDVRIFAWTDSSIVLHWLAAPPKNWSVFIGNRTSEILTSIPIKSWNHVRSESNPADVATRGMLPSILGASDIWWKGPQYLWEHKDKWRLSYYNKEEIDSTQLEERKTSNSQVFITNTSSLNELENVLFNYSGWLKCVRVIAYVMRFLKNCRLSSDIRIFGALSLEEITLAKIHLVKVAQLSIFYAEIKTLKNKKELPPKNRLLSLTPFIDSNGVLRVGGRLEYSDLKYEEKHPILLCKSHPIAKLIVEYTHKKHLHPGVSLLFALVRQNYYILGCRNLARKVVHDCVICFRQRQTTCRQLMGNLPKERIRYSRPFSRVGCDYAGPVMIRVNRGRNPRFEKAYIALFVCFVTKAIHIELVGDLSSGAFLLALDRFVSRRGKPQEIWSDNGTNFHGAKRLLNELHNLLCSQQHNNIIIDHLSKDNIQWKFIPPSSPHFGGLWESGVRSVKLHLKRVIGDNKLTYEDMYTLLTKIEAILNSRPLWQTSDSDPIALSPSHFLIGEAYTAIPQPDISTNVISIKTNWALLQAMLQGFWKRWHNEFLTSLQQRPKWQGSHRNLEIDDVVLLKEPNLPPLKWIIGRIIKTHPGADNVCRVVTIRTKFGDYTRPTIKVVPLPSSERP